MPSEFSHQERWNSFEEGDKNAKQYTAFLRFVFKAYMIPARVNIRWMNQNDRPRSNNTTPRLAHAWWLFSMPPPRSKRG